MTESPVVRLLRMALNLPERVRITAVEDRPEGAIWAVEIGSETCRGFYDRRQTVANPSRWLEFQLDDPDGVTVLVAPRGQKLRLHRDVLVRLVAGLVAASAQMVIHWVAVHAFKDHAKDEHRPPLGWDVLVVGTTFNMETIRDRLIRFKISADPDGAHPQLTPDPQHLEPKRLLVNLMETKRVPEGFRDTRFNLPRMPDDEHTVAVFLPPLTYDPSLAPAGTQRALSARSSLGHDYVVVVPAVGPPLASERRLCADHPCANAPLPTPST